MNERRDDETEPMTRLPGVVVREPHEGEPQRRLIDAGQTRLEIARPRPVSAEPPTQIVHASMMRRPPLSIDNATTVPGDVQRRWPNEITPQPRSPLELMDRQSPSGPIRPVFAPRLAQADRQEITASRKPPQRALPYLLGIALVLCLVAGASILRDRARAAGKRSIAAAAATELAREPQALPLQAAAPQQPKAATPLAPAPQPTRPEPPLAAQPAARPAVPATQPAAVAPTEPAAVVPSPVVPSPDAPSPVAPSPVAPSDPAAVAELEKRAVDRLSNNDHEAALALYTELARAQPKHPAYPAMVLLLTRRVRACQGDPACAQ